MDFESFRRHAFAHVCEAKSSQRVPTEGGKLTLIVVGTIPWAGGPEEIKGGKEKAESGYCPLCFLGLSNVGSSPALYPCAFPATK